MLNTLSNLAKKNHNHVGSILHRRPDHNKGVQQDPQDLHFGKNLVMTLHNLCWKQFALLWKKHNTFVFPGKYSLSTTGYTGHHKLKAQSSGPTV